MFGMIVHSFFDGVAIASGFKIDIDTGYLVFVGVMLHKIPEGLTISSISLANHPSRIKALISGAYVSISTLVGAMFVNLIDKLMIMDHLIGVGISILSGVFVFITFNLLSIVHQKNERNSFLVIIGIGIALVNHYLHP